MSHGCEPSLAIGKVPDAGRQGVTKEAQVNLPRAEPCAVNAAGGPLMTDQG